MEKWYPKKVLVGPEGTPGTYHFMAECFDQHQHFSYAELGIYNADTALRVCQQFPNASLHLFDFQESVDAAAEKLADLPNRIFFYGNSQRFNDSYNWALLQLIQTNGGKPIFDYVFLDGAHTFAVDGLSYFLCDLLLRPDGYIDFDDYNWRLRGSSLDPEHIPAIASQYTEEQIDAYQVKLIVDELVRKNPNYEEVMENKVFRKLK